MKITKMKTISFFISCILFCSLSVFGQEIVFKGSSIAVTTNFSFLKDSLEVISESDILEGKYDDQFLKATKIFAKPKEVNVFWLKFALRNGTQFDEELILDFENWAYVDFFLKDEFGTKKKQTGHLLAYRNRDLPIADQNYLKTALKSGEKIDCYVKLTNERSISKIPNHLEFGISKSETVIQKDAQVGKIIYGFLAVFVVMFMYNFFIFVVTRQRSYIYYLGVILCAFYFTSNNSGYHISIFKLFDSFPFWSSKFEYIGSNVAAIIYLFFLQSLMQTKQFYPRWDKILMALIYVYLFNGILFYINFDLAYGMFSIVAVVTLIFTISLGVKCIKDKRPSAKYLLFGYIFNALGVFSMLFTLFGILPKTDFTTSYSLPLGLTIEMLFYSFALANVINVLKRDNEEKQKRNIEQLIENQNLQKKLNLELEDKVKERTSELNASIVKLHKAQDQLVLKEKLASLGELTAGIAHEIQNPLNFVNNFSQLSKELSEELSEEVVKEDMDKKVVLEILADIGSNQEKIHHHGERASSIVRSMLMHSQKNGGEKEFIDLNRFIKENFNISYNSALASDGLFKVEIKYNLDESIQTIELIPQDFSRVLLNIFGNALYAIKSKIKNGLPNYSPKIEVNTAIKNGKVEVRIFDNGMGIPKNISSKIFQPFFTTKPTGEGTGLGLSISYEIIVNGHGGNLEDKSKEGDFTEFTITIPSHN